MAFDPHYSSSSFSNIYVPSITKDGNYWYKENLPFSDDEFMKNYIMSSPSASSSRRYFSEEFGVPGFGSFQECDVKSHHFDQSYPVYCATQCLMEENKCGFEDKSRGAMGANYQPAPEDNWEIQEQRRVQKVEEATAKVNRYSVEERREKILKYLKKRNQRNFNKTIKYACRKTLADRRMRVRGRFAKNSEINEDEAVAFKNNGGPFQVNDNRYYDNNGSFQMNLSDEEWLQEAIASLTCAPYTDNHVINGPTFFLDTFDQG